MKSSASKKAPNVDALADRPDDDVAGGLHEHDLEQHEVFTPAS